MDVGIRDDTLLAGGFGTIAEGVKALGVASVELVYGRDGTVRSLVAGGETLNLDREAGRAALTEQSAKAGVRVAALMMANNFNAPDLAAEVDWVLRAAEAAQALGIPALRIDSIMRGEREMSLEDRVARFTTALREVLPATERTGIVLGIENHGACGNDPAFLARVLDSFDNPRLGLTLDTGNFYWHGNPLSELYRIYERFAPRVKHTHMKSIRYPAELRETRREIGYKYGEFASPLDEGDIDLARVITLLRRAGYSGDLTIENESVGRYPAGERAAILRRDAEHLRLALRRSGGFTPG
jgi:sugar phosphate isomerase/epimerase